jgi:surfactin synthase thioesterase subunit
VHEYFRSSRVLVDGGHFLLESTLDAVVAHIRGFLARSVDAARAA